MSKYTITSAIFFLTTLFCYSAGIVLSKYEPDRAIRTGVEKILIIINHRLLLQCIDISNIKINMDGQIVMKKDSILDIPPAPIKDTWNDADPEQDQIIQQFFTADHETIVFSYARKSGIEIGRIQYQYGILKRIADGWSLESSGLFDSMIKDKNMTLNKN